MLFFSSKLFTCVKIIETFFCVFSVDGFLFLLLGTALYNQLLIIPPLMPKPDSTQQVTLFVNVIPFECNYVALCDGFKSHSDH